MRPPNSALWEGEMLSGNALRVIESVAVELPLSLDLPTSLPFDDWVNLGRRLCQGQHAINWHIGDWWAFGDHRYGERAKVAAEGIFGREFQTLANLASIARAYEPSRRREVVSFTHHAEVAGLEPEIADSLLDRAARDHLSAKDVRREVQAMKAGNDTAPLQTAQPAIVRASPQPPVPRNELTEAYGRYVEAMEALQTFRELTRREADFYAFALDKLGEAHAERRPVPDDFKIVFVEQGRIACESWYRASRITVNRWLLQSGKQGLIEERSKFVKHQRDVARGPDPQPQTTPATDPFLPIARMAAEHMRISRYGGWLVSQCETGGWRVGTVHKSSEELIAMAERQGFDRQAAVTEARQEGY
jgi:hypothetical protein